MKKLLYMVSIILIIVGCGGGGGGTKENAKIELTTDAKAVAYSTKDVSWNPKSDKVEDLGNGFKKYTIYEDGNYKVALNCNKILFIFALNSSSNSSLYFKCPAILSFYSNLNGSIKDSVDNAQNFAVAAYTDYAILQNNSNPNFSLNVKNGKTDLIGVTFSSSIVPKRFYIKRDITTPALSSQNIVISATNSVLVKKGGNFSGANSEDRLILITKNDTYFTSSILNNGWYYPDGALSSDDIFLNYSYDSNKKVFKTVMVEATNIEKKDINNIALPTAKLSGITYANGAINNLKYTPSSDSLEFKAYLLDIRGNPTYKKIIRVAISKEYLKTQNSSSFKIENLTAIDGFSDVYDGSNVVSIEATAMMSNSKLYDIFKSQRYLNLSTCKMFLLKDATIEYASFKVK